MSGIRHHILSVSVFIVLAALDFMPMHFHGWMILPLLWLSMCALSRKQYVLATALFFSFLGDVMGWKRELIPQIGFFALAQVTYIILFSLLKPPSATWPKPVRMGFLLLLAGIYGTATCWIFPRVTDSIVMGGMAVYALLLLAMCYAAFCHKNLCLTFGAVLFVVSDFIIGVNLFVCHIPHFFLCIMVPYYLGQLLLYVGAQRLY